MGKFFAFAMLVLIILVIIQFSTLSEEDVAKIKAQIEEQQKTNDQTNGSSNSQQARKNNQSNVSVGNNNETGK